MRFFVGVKPWHMPHLKDVMVSAIELRRRKKDVAPAGDWIMDSGAFSIISLLGDYPYPPEEYAEHVVRWARCGCLLAAVSQDYMCEPFILERTGLTVGEHQYRTIERYSRIIRAAPDVYIMPVLQGYEPREYLQHLHAYGSLLGHGAWVGVGSVCKRNIDPLSILSVLEPIKQERPDLRLHGFGVKKTALNHPRVRHLLHSADSFAWNLHARKNRLPRYWHHSHAKAFANEIMSRPFQRQLDV